MIRTLGNLSITQIRTRAIIVCSVTCDLCACPGTHWLSSIYVYYVLNARFPKTTHGYMNYAVMYIPHRSTTWAGDTGSINSNICALIQVHVSDINLNSIVVDHYSRTPKSSSTICQSQNQSQSQDCGGKRRGKQKNREKKKSAGNPRGIQSIKIPQNPSKTDKWQVTW